MGKEGKDNKWADIDRAFRRNQTGERQESPTESRKSEIKEELLTKRPEELLAGIEADPKKIQIAKEQILDAQRNYEQIAEGKEDDELTDIRWVWSKTIERLIEMLSK